MKAAAPWLLAAGSGLALALALPGAGWTPLVLLFPGLLLEALERCRGRTTPWILGWLAGAVHWAVATNWVLPVMHHYGGLPMPLALICLIGMGLILGTLWAVAAGITSVVPADSRIWLFPAAWIALSVLQRFPPFGFTWTGVASVFVDQSWLMSSLAVWGASGLGWCVITIAAALWGLGRVKTRQSATAALLVATGTACLAILAAPAPSPSGEPLKVAAIQPGTSLEEKWDPSQSREIAERVWEMTGAAAARGAELVLWPESAVPYRIDADPAYLESVEGMAAELGVEILLNSVASDASGGYTNSAYLVTPEGVSPSRYDKVHLVPFGEFVPDWARFAFTESLVREVGAFSPGDKPLVLPARVPIGVAICFEVVFPDHVAGQVRAGAEALTTLTNDGWYGFSWAPRQHFEQVRLRAAETQRWFVRAALTGISGFIDPSGRVVESLDLFEAGIALQRVQPMRGLTPRVRFGDWWAILCAVASVVVVVASRIPRRQRKPEKIES